MHKSQLATQILTAGFIGLVVSSIYSCGGSDSSQTLSPFEELNKIEGNWEMAFEGSLATEHWEKINDTLFEGKSYEITGGDSVLSETVQLYVNREGVFYAPQVPDQNEGKRIVFKLISSTDSLFRFENPAHDFPTTITYAFLPGDRLKATISGEIKGQERSLDFDYERSGSTASQ